MQDEPNSIFYFLQLPSAATVTNSHVTTTSNDVDTSLVLTSATTSAPTTKVISTAVVSKATVTPISTVSTTTVISTSSIPTTTVIHTSIAPTTTIIHTTIVPTTTVTPISTLSTTTVTPITTLSTTTVIHTSIVPITTAISTTIVPTTAAIHTTIVPTTTVVHTSIVPTTTVTPISTVSTATVVHTSIVPITTVISTTIVPTTTVVHTSIVPTTTVTPISTVSTTTVVHTSIVPTTTAIHTSIVPTTTVIHTSIVPITTVISTTILPTTAAIHTTIVPTTTVVHTSIVPITTVISTTILPSTAAIHTTIVPTTTLIHTSIGPTTSAITTTKVATTHHQIVATTATSVPVISIFWNFDNNTNDLYNVYNGVPSSISYSALGITGYGAALSLTYLSTSYVSVSSPYINLRNRSFTVDAWVYPDSGMYGNDYPIMVLCPSVNNYQCMQVLMRVGKPMLTFYYDDCLSLNILNTSTWTHLAYVYNYASKTMILYVNGYLDTNCTAVSPFQGTPSASLHIGASSSPQMYYSGLIDQLSIVTRVKSASEILDTASLVIYYSFDNQSLLDSGPNLINGTGINTNFALGRVNEAITFNTTRSYAQINNLVLFGTQYWPYSFAFWIYPYSTKNATLIHTWKPSAPTSYCMPILGFTASGSIAAQTWNSTQILTILGPVILPNTWVHIAHTYSRSNGISLYVNGTLMVNNRVFSTNPAASAPLTIALGYCVNTTLCSCASDSIVSGQFHGMMDEFRVYSRLLNASEVLALANP